MLATLMIGSASVSTVCSFIRSSSRSLAGIASSLIMLCSMASMVSDVWWSPLVWASLLFFSGFLESLLYRMAADRDDRKFPEGINKRHLHLHGPLGSIAMAGIVLIMQPHGSSVVTSGPDHHVHGSSLLVQFVTLFVLIYVAGVATNLYRMRRKLRIHEHIDALAMIMMVAVMMAGVHLEH